MRLASHFQLVAFENFICRHFRIFILLIFSCFLMSCANGSEGCDRHLPPETKKKLFLRQENEFWAKNCAVVNFRWFRVCSWSRQKFNSFSHGRKRSNAVFVHLVCPKCPLFTFWNPLYGFERKTVNRISKIWSFIYVSLIILRFKLS